MCKFFLFFFAGVSFKIHVCHYSRHSQGVWCSWTKVRQYFLTSYLSFLIVKKLMKVLIREVGLFWHLFNMYKWKNCLMIQSNWPCYIFCSHLMVEFINNVPKERLTKQKLKCIDDLVHSKLFVLPGENTPYIVIYT